jgi:hypothetical protein
MTRRRILLALVAAICLSTLSRAQDYASQYLTQTIQLSQDETAKAKQAVSDLKAARQRLEKARDAWDDFHKSYQVEHPELGYVKFSPDLQFAFGNQDLGSGLHGAAEVELTPDEHRKLEALHTEVVQSQQSAKEAEAKYDDFQWQLLANHFPNTGSDNAHEHTLTNGTKVRLPLAWSNGVRLTPDFRFALPL